jgi:hypothetical protein
VLRGDEVVGLLPFTFVAPARVVSRVIGRADVTARRGVDNPAAAITA